MKSSTYVRDLLQDTSQDIFTVSAQATAADCAASMVNNHIGCLLVQDNEELVGIITTHDLVSGLANKREELTNTLASKLMNQTLITTSEDTALEEVEAQMKEEHIHYLPVLTDGKIVGVVTLADVLTLHLNREETLEADLESYIYGVTRPKF